ncbi:hypothetical protein [Pseudomonas oligotrophica]|uniref:hypothetical protein n=1 Tax=Pseudomonas oligotrophica TaxID=2912055 RepID=UPI001F2519B4|nr:hypothetical protein [Pseudomonas oligotrophica]MCF7203105.1 hypothetical protein [Pseudomonas oligotrophica]
MTTTALTLDNAMKIASEAFLPYGCVTGANPDDDSFGLTVMNGDGEELLRVPRIDRQHYADPLRMAETLEQHRRELHRKGCALDDWSMPFITDDSAIPAITPNY